MSLSWLPVGITVTYIRSNGLRDKTKVVSFWHIAKGMVTSKHWNTREWHLSAWWVPSHVVVDYGTGALSLG